MEFTNQEYLLINKADFDKQQLAGPVGEGALA